MCVCTVCVKCSEEEMLSKAGLILSFCVSLFLYSFSSLFFSLSSILPPTALLSSFFFFLLLLLFFCLLPRTITHTHNQYIHDVCIYLLLLFCFFLLIVFAVCLIQPLDKGRTFHTNCLSNLHQTNKHQIDIYIHTTNN